MFFDSPEKRADQARTKVEETRRRYAEAQAAQAAAAAALLAAQEQLADADDPIPALRAARTALAEAEELVGLRETAVTRAESAAKAAEAEALEERQRQAVTAYRTAAQHLAEALEAASSVSERLREIQAEAPRSSDLPQLHWPELQPEGESRLVYWRSELLRFADPPAPRKPQGVRVRFLDTYEEEHGKQRGPAYMVGERADLPRDLAEDLVREGIAERV